MSGRRRRPGTIVTHTVAFDSGRGWSRFYWFVEPPDFAERHVRSVLETIVETGRCPGVIELFGPFKSTAAVELNQMRTLGHLPADVIRGGTWCG